MGRYEDNGDGTISDCRTGLIWLKDANCFGAQDWPTAVTSANNLNNSQCSLNDGSVAGDWRLPNSKELQSLVERQNVYPSLPADHPFGSTVQSDGYWSSSTFVNSNYAWVVGLDTGYLDAASLNINGNKGDIHYVWPVRAGQFGDSVISVLPAAKNFSTVTVSGSSSQTIAISNNGTASRLHINAMVLSGTNTDKFALNVGNGSNGTCGSKTPIIAPGGNCTVSVIFTPGTLGAKAASLRISGSDVNAPNVDIPLSGTGATTYNITYNGNGNSSGMVPSDASNYLAGDTVTVLGSGTLTKTGYTFAGWNSAANGSGTNYAAAATFAIPDNATLYAQWTINSYTVTFDSNAGSGTMSVQSANYDVATALTTNSFTRTGYAFVGWNTLANGTGTSYGNGAAYPFTSSTTLYAKWTAITYTVTPTAGTGSSMTPATAQTVNSGAATSFTIAPAAGYSVLSVSGCNGTLSGTTYTTGAITASCAVSVTSVKRNANGGTAADPTIADALKSLQAYTGAISLTAAEKLRYDVAPLAANGVPQGNGVIDIADVILTLRRSVGIGSW
jgi:uncharacterized repeat protein (TIGR02543 family)